MADKGPLLVTDALTKLFDRARAVDNVSLDIPAGQFVGVIGRSGAGKSTLLRLMNRLTDPSAGRVLFDGIEVTVLKRLPPVCKSVNTALPQYCGGPSGPESAAGAPPMGVSKDRYLESLGLVAGS